MSSREIKYQLVFVRFLGGRGRLSILHHLWSLCVLVTGWLKVKPWQSQRLCCCCGAPGISMLDIWLSEAEVRDDALEQVPGHIAGRRLMAALWSAGGFFFLSCSFASENMANQGCDGSFRPSTISKRSVEMSGVFMWHSGPFQRDALGCCRHKSTRDNSWARIVHKLCVDLHVCITMHFS